MQPAPIAAERLTAEDYRALPGGGPRYQLIDGELHMAPAPGSYHQEIAWNLTQIFGAYLRVQPIGRAYFAPCDVYLSEHDVVQPDLLYFTKARQHIRKDDGIHGAPELVIEILSPSTALLDTKTKRAIYARSGVKELWIIDPSLRQIHLYDFARHPTKATRLVDEEETFESVLLPGLSISAAEVFKR